MDWTKVVTSPLGLSGFALFLVFSYLSTRQRSSVWVVRSFVALSALSLLGGLVLSYAVMRNQQEAAAPKTKAQMYEAHTEAALAGPSASASGNCSTAVAGSVAASGSISIGGCVQLSGAASTSSK